DDAEHGGGQTNAEGEGRDDERCEAWTSTYVPQRVAGVLQELVCPDRDPHRARIFFYSCDAAECAACRRVCLFSRHASRDVLFGFARKVVANVLVEIGERAAAAPDHAGLRTRAMALASFSQLEVSTASCFSPLAVSS